MASATTPVKKPSLGYLGTFNPGHYEGAPATICLR